MIAEVVAAVALTRGPVAESVTQRSAIISFRTAARDHSFVILQNGARIDAGTGVDHVARLTRLTPGMHYAYTVRTDSGVLAKGTFRAAPARAATFTFAVVGDFGSGNRNETAVASMIESWHPDFVLTVGDNAYPLGAAGLLDRVIFGPYAAVMRRSAWFPRSATTTSRRTAGSPSSRRSTRSATSAGTLHLGEHRRGGPGLQRLRRSRLAAAALRAQLARADLLLPLRRLAPPTLGAPREHHLARPSPQHRAAGGEGRSAGGVRGPPPRLCRSRPHNGVLYVAVGTGGAELENDAGDLTIPSARVVQGHFGALRVDVAGRTARFRYQTVDGKVRDDFRLRCS